MKDWLIAVALFGTYHHCGQWSNGYRWQCQARILLERWYGITHIKEAEYQPKSVRDLYYAVVDKYHERV